MSPRPRLLKDNAPCSRELLERVRDGDADALTVVYERHADALRNALRTLLGSDDDVEDVVQDVFVALPEALAHYTETEHFDGWLRRVALRLGLNRLRSRARKREDALEDSLPSFRGIANDDPSGAERLLDRLALERAIAKLPDSLRTVFVLREIEGYSHAEIAQLLGVTRAASEIRLVRAMRRLQSLLS